MHSTDGCEHTWSLTSICQEVRVPVYQFMVPRSREESDLWVVLQSMKDSHDQKDVRNVHEPLGLKKFPSQERILCLSSCEENLHLDLTSLGQLAKKERRGQPQALSHLTPKAHEPPQKGRPVGEISTHSAQYHQLVGASQSVTLCSCD